MDIPNKEITREQFHDLTNGPHTEERQAYCSLFNHNFEYSKENARTILTTDVIDERRYQMAKWGDGVIPTSELLAILGEEVGEACKAYLEKDAEEYRAELVQVAAVALRGIQMIDRQERRFYQQEIGPFWYMRPSKAPLALEETPAPDAIEPQALLQ